MLTRNCAIEKLLNERDFNVRVTVFDPASVSEHPICQKAAWLEVIRDALGGGIVNSVDRYKVIIQNAAGRKLISGIVTGVTIKEIIDAFCKEPQPLRISIAHASDTSKLRHWLIV